MGFFSWFTSDTDKSIANKYSSRPTFTVHMITEDGQVFTENDYDGYGVFGGKDIYVLIAEMNGFKGKDDDETRDNAFKHIWKRGIEKDGKRYFYQDDFPNYEHPIESEGGICPNKLVSEHGWTNFGDGGEFEEWAKLGFKVPKLVENLTPNWKENWNKIPYPVSCPEQGFFYDDEYEEDEDGFWQYDENDEDNENI